MDREVKEEVTSPGLGASRLVQLDRDLSMTAADRVRAAEAALDEVAVRGGPPGAIEEPRRFGSYEDFAAWRRARGDGTAPERLDPSAEAYLRRLDEIARDLKAAGVTGLTEQLLADRR